MSDRLCTNLLIRIFIVSVGVLLLVTGSAKLLSVVIGEVPLLEVTDPIFGIPFRYEFALVGAIELLVAFMCFLRTRTTMQAGLITWLGTVLAIYRLGVWFIGWRLPCSCLGLFSESLHVSPRDTDFLMKTLLTYMLIGGYSSFFWLLRQASLRQQVILT